MASESWPDCRASEASEASEVDLWFAPAKRAGGERSALVFGEPVNSSERRERAASGATPCCRATGASERENCDQRVAKASSQPQPSTSKIGAVRSDFSEIDLGGLTSPPPVVVIITTHDLDLIRRNVAIGLCTWTVTAT